MSEWLSPRLRDDEETRARLERWLEGQLPDARDVRILELDRPRSGGASGETYLLRSSWDEGAGTAETVLVVRGAPTDYQTIYLSSIDRQFRVLEALAATPVPAPRPRWIEHDPDVLGTPFFVMEGLPGSAPSDFPIYNEAGFLADAPPAFRRRLWESAVDTLVEVHRVDPAPFAFLAGDHGASGVDQALGYIGEALQWASDRNPPRGLAEALEWAWAHAPAGTAPGLTWADARIGNMLFVDGHCTGALDWEGAFFGGPLVDLGWWLLFDVLHGEDYGAPRLEGLGDRAETIERWERGTGRRADDVEWYEILAGVRLGVARLRAINMRGKLGLWVPEEDDPRGVRRLERRLESMIAAAPV